MGVTWVAAAMLLWSNTIVVTCGLKEWNKVRTVSDNSVVSGVNPNPNPIYSLCTKSNIKNKKIKNKKQINDTEQKPSLGRLSSYTSTHRMLLLKDDSARFWE